MYDLIKTIVANINTGIPKELQLGITHSPVTGNFQIFDGKVNEQKDKADAKRKAKTEHVKKSKTAGRILPLPTRFSEAHEARVARAKESDEVKKDRLQEMRDRIKAEMEARALTEASSSGGGGGGDDE
jgi:predicted transcriptional regulator